MIEGYTPRFGGEIGVLVRGGFSPSMAFFESAAAVVSQVGIFRNFPCAISGILSRRG